MKKTDGSKDIFNDHLKLLDDFIHSSPIKNQDGSTEEGYASLGSNEEIKFEDLSLKKRR